MNRFKHKPKLGDIIYSLPLIKSLGGGILYLDPVSEHFLGEEEIWKKRFKWLMPLIKIQPYIRDVKIYEGEDYDYDLDDYMDTTHLIQYDKVNIVDNHFIGQGLEPIPYKKWLNCEQKQIIDKYIIVANSSNHHDDNVDYSAILKKHNFCFIGTEQERICFEKRCNSKICLFYVNNALDLMKLINKFEIFMGNQSLPLSIALGLGKKCYVEQSPLYPNCIMGNYYKL